MFIYYEKNWASKIGLLLILNINKLNIFFMILFKNIIGISLILSSKVITEIKESLKQYQILFF
jgi:hypothetical protein